MGKHSGNQGGAPRMYKTPEEMEAIGQEYFKKCKDEDRPITVTGLALALGMTRLGLINYEGRKRFVNAVKRMKTICEEYVESIAITKGHSGSIFCLKNFKGWHDVSQVDHGLADSLADKFKGITNDDLKKRAKDLIE